MNPDTQRLCAPLFSPDHPSNDSHNVHRQVFPTRPTMSTISIQPAPGLSWGPDFNRYLSVRRPHFLNPARCGSMPISLPPGLSQGHARNDDQMDVALIFYMKGI